MSRTVLKKHPRISPIDANFSWERGHFAGQDSELRTPNSELPTPNFAFEMAACAGEGGLYDFWRIMKLKRPQSAPNRSVVKLFRVAEQALQRKDFHQNFELLERARQPVPANPATLTCHSA